MNMRHLVFAALLVANMPSASASAEDPPASAAEVAEEAAGRAYLASLHGQLAASKSPRERALATRLHLAEDRSGDARVLRAAAQAAPEDPLVQMLWSGSDCEADASCPEQKLAWARLEPDNGFAWMPDFEGRGEHADARAIDADIARIAAAPRFDDHLVDFWLAYRRIYAAHPMSAAMSQEEAVAVAAMANAAAMPLPMKWLARHCTRASHPEAAAARFEDCARIGRGIAASDSSVWAKMLGTAIVRGSGLQDAADRQARRSLEWRQYAVGRATDERLHPGGLAAYFADLASTGNESRAQELSMARYGIALEPPAAWRPAQ